MSFPEKLWHGARETVKRYRATIRAGLIVLVALAAIWFMVWLDGLFGWTGYGIFRSPDNVPAEEAEISWGKTIWEWLELLVVPIILAIAAYLFSRSERATEHDIARNREQESALQNYLDKMTELLLENKLRRKGLEEPDAEVRDIARVRTLTVLRGLDGPGKGIVLRFLHEASLVNSPADIELSGADLSGANLSGADLGMANLREANIADLRKADLSGADLSEANLSGADLREADLREADLGMAKLREADLGMANLRGADLSEAILYEAKLRDANLSRADLRKAILYGADLREADLRWANLREADLRWANLREADLHKADLHRADLSGADLSEDTTLPDGTKWTLGADLARFT